MKLLPCPRCGTAQTPAGEPLAIGRLSSSPLRFTCGGCRRSVVVTAQEWNRLPEHQATRFKDGQPLQPMKQDQREASSIISPKMHPLVQRGGSLLQ